MQPDFKHPAFGIQSPFITGLYDELFVDKSLESIKEKKGIKPCQL